MTMRYPIAPLRTRLGNAVMLMTRYTTSASQRVPCEDKGSWATHRTWGPLKRLILRQFAQGETQGASRYPPCFILNTIPGDRTAPSTRQQDIQPGHPDGAFVRLLYRVESGGQQSCRKLRTFSHARGMFEHFRTQTRRYNWPDLG